MPRPDIKDEYEIVAEIGAGGMATVYKAIQKSLDRPVAIKELKKTYHGDMQTVRRFERESKMAASLQHENIVHIYDYWKKPAYSIVMEYVEGTNLSEILDTTGSLRVDVGIMIALQVSNALEYAHMRGLIHRDIKPSNIMVSRNGEVKLMDFGIAHTQNLEPLTMPGTLIGTPAYMSPEQILGQQLDARSDIFSLGIVLYEMLTGAKPFADEETRAISAKIVADGFQAPRRINNKIPWRLQWIIKKCLRKKPRRRYGSMLEVQRKLERLLAGKTTKAFFQRRIADYLAAMKITETGPDHETTAVSHEQPGMTLLKKAALIAAAIVMIAAGAFYYSWTDDPYQPLVVLPPAATSPISKPQITTTGTPTIQGAVQQETLSQPASTSVSRAQ